MFCCGCNPPPIPPAKLLVPRLFEGPVGTKPVNPVRVGTRGCSSPWFPGMGAKGPLGPLTFVSCGWRDKPLDWNCPIGTGEFPTPMLELNPGGGETITGAGLGLLAMSDRCGWGGGEATTGLCVRKDARRASWLNTSSSVVFASPPPVC
jgi:hypothetical protein